MRRIERQRAAVRRTCVLRELRCREQLQASGERERNRLVAAIEPEAPRIELLKDRRLTQGDAEWIDGRHSEAMRSVALQQRSRRSRVLTRMLRIVSDVGN